MKFENATLPWEVAWVLEASCTKPRQDPRALQIQMGMIVIFTVMIILRARKTSCSIGVEIFVLAQYFGQTGWWVISHEWQVMSIT